MKLSVVCDALENQRTEKVRILKDICGIDVT